MAKKTEKTTKTAKNTAATNPMAALLSKNKPSLLKKGREIEAKIVSLSKKGIVFDVGGKAHAILGELEIKEVSTYLPYLKAGDKIQVRVISEESKNGFPVVSLRKFFEKGKWEILAEKKEKEEEIEVFCGDYGKGGVFVDFMGIRGVIPKIQLVEPFISSPEKLTGQKIKVKILEVDKEKNRLVVSQKASVLKISQKDLKKKFDAIKEGKTYKAKVLGASEFGVFCEVEGVEGVEGVVRHCGRSIFSARRKRKRAEAERRLPAGLPPGRRRYKNRGVPHTPVFLQKSAELLEEGGVDVPRDARGVCKCMKTLGRVFETARRSAQEVENREDVC